MIKSYKVRIFPTKDQEQLIYKHIGCCRFIWNYMLDLQQTRYKNKEQHLSAFDMMKLFTPLKKQEEYKWLNEVSNMSLCNICRDLDKAFQNLFKKIKKHPKFKSRKTSKLAYPLRCDRTYFKSSNTLQIEKLGKVKCKTDFNFPIGKDIKITDPRLINQNGKWLVCFGMESENQASTLTDKPMGIDLGIKELMVVAYGDEEIIFHNINKSKKMRLLEKRRKHTERSIARKYRTNNSYEKTNNIIKEENKLRKLYAKQTNIRNNYIHQLTHKLVSLLPSKVVMEDLNVSGMMKNKHLSKAIMDAKFYEIIRQMQYKCEWLGIPFLQVNKFYPSSKTCSYCGTVKHNLKLKDRIFTCESCGLTIDRDYNAALNLQRYKIQ
jgi:putative transposase